MAENAPKDKRLEHLKQRLHDELVDEEGRPVEADQVARVVDAKAEAFADAPVQDFVPLLIEHEASGELRRQGVHRDFGDEQPDDAPAPDRASVELEAEDWPDYGNEPL